MVNQCKITKNKLQLKITTRIICSFNIVYLEQSNDPIHHNNRGHLSALSTFDI